MTVTPPDPGRLEPQALAAVKRYFDAAQDGDADAIASLYAEDGVLLPSAPGSVPITGRAAIRTHYDSRVSGVIRRFDDLLFVVDGDRVAVEVKATTVDIGQAIYAVDAFTIAENGCIERMASYQRQSRDEREPIDPVEHDARRELSARSKAVAKRYLKAAEGGDTETIVDLYAEDAVFLPVAPHTKILRGRSEIRDHYAEHVSAINPRFVNLAWTVDGFNVVVEIDSEVPNRPHRNHVVDVFTMTSSGRIARMAAYRSNVR
jgi:uncharacterized protein (TIGR02246 family)